MDKNIKEFLEEMDGLTKDGVFGDNAKMYSYLKDRIDTKSFFIKVYFDWLNNKNQIGKDKVQKIITLLLKLYCDCLKVNPDKTLEIMAYFVDGIKTIPDSDIVTPLYVWFQSLTNWRDSLPTGKNPGSDFQVAQNAITVHQKGVELVNKILVVLLCFKYESNGDSYKPIEIYESSLFKKIERYKKIFEEEFLFIINLIDRNLRNAESHLQLRYSRRLKKIIYIVRRKSDMKRMQLDIRDFLFNYFPNPGYIIQGYIFSMILFVLIGQIHISDLKKIKM